MLPLALADGADVDDERGGGIEAVFLAQLPPVVGGGETLDALEVDPARERAEVVVGIELLEDLSRGAGGEDDPAGVLDGLLDERHDLRRGEAVLGKEFPRGVALVDVEGGGLAEDLGEADHPVGDHGVAHDEVDVGPAEAGGKGLQVGAEIRGGLGLDETAGVEQLDRQAGVLEFFPQWSLDRGEHAHVPAGLFREIPGVLEDEQRRPLEVEVVGDHRDPELERAAGVAVVVDVELEAGGGVVHDLADVRVAVARVALHEGEVFPLRVGVAPRRAPEVRERGLRRVHGPVAGAGGAQAIVDVVVRDLEIALIETAQLAVKLGAGQQAGARDGGGVARGVREKQVAKVVFRLADEDRVSESALRADPDAGMIEGLVGVDEPGAHNPDAGHAHPAGHVLEPAGLAGLDVVVEVEDQRGVGRRRAEVDEPRIIEGRRDVAGADDATRQVGPGCK